MEGGAPPFGLGELRSAQGPAGLDVPDHGVLEHARMGVEDRPEREVEVPGPPGGEDLVGAVEVGGALVGRAAEVFEHRPAAFEHRPHFGLHGQNAEVGRPPDPHAGETAL